MKHNYRAFAWPSGGWYVAEVHDDGSHVQPGIQTRQNSQCQRAAERTAKIYTSDSGRPVRPVTESDHSFDPAL